MLQKVNAQTIPTVAERAEKIERPAKTKYFAEKLPVASWPGSHWDVLDFASPPADDDPLNDQKTVAIVTFN